MYDFNIVQIEESYSSIGDAARSLCVISNFVFELLKSNDGVSSKSSFCEFCVLIAISNLNCELKKTVLWIKEGILNSQRVFSAMVISMLEVYILEYQFVIIVLYR